jgi:hypothetical protein
VISGTRIGARPDGTLGANQGLCLLMQEVTLVQNGTNTVNATFYLPKHSVIVDVLVDTTTAWNSGTSDNFTLGTSSADTTYVGGTVGSGPAVSVTATGRVRAAYTAAQLAAMLDTGTNETFVATVTPAGTAATTGQTTVTIIYAQTPNWQP